MTGDREAKELFSSLVAIEIGNGKNVLFWSDRWIKGYTAAEVAPLLVSLVPTRVRNRRTVEEARRDNAWILDCQGEWPEGGAVQCVRLWTAISEIGMDATRQDSFRWKGALSGNYSARGTYNLLCLGQVGFDMAEPIWRSHAPLKCKIFAWLALNYRLWTSDRRQRHGLQTSTDACAVCLQDVDCLDHVLVQCSFAKQVWFGCLRRARLRLPEPQGDVNWEHWWSDTRGQVIKRDRRRFHTLVILTAWMIWKQRNARVFGNDRDRCNEAQLIDRIHDEFKIWGRVRRGGGGGEEGERLDRE
jgi:hypothetical protein